MSPQTPNSSATAYLTVDEFVNRNDLNAVAMLAVDDGSKPTQGQLESNANLAAVLDEASGEVESMLLGSERYSAVDLQALSGVSLAFLKGIVSDLAMFKLYGRRSAPNPPETVVEKHERAQEKLEQLRTGQRVLSFAQSEAAGVPSDEFLSVTDIQNQNLFTYNCRRSLGNRNNVRRLF